jgi:hypothetical protein
VDPSQTGPALAPGHPFNNVHSSQVSPGYWSATTTAADSGFAWFVSFSFGSVGDGNKSFSDILAAWCVRGGQGVDPQ